MRQGKVYLNNVYAGVLKEEPGKGYTFTYDDVFFADTSLPAISLTLPKDKKEHSSPFLFPFFSNMLSEGYNRRFQAMIHHIDEADDFGILLATAHSDTPGAVTVKKDTNE